MVAGDPGQERGPLENTNEATSEAACELPAASIIIAAYNAEKYIRLALQSIINQDFEDFEVLVVNDGSTDRTSECVAQFPDPRIRLINTSNSGGPSRPRNIGLKAARGKYFFIFDADDVMLPGKLRESVAILERVEIADFLFTNFQSIGPNGDVIKTDFLSDYETLQKLPAESVAERARLLRGPDLLVGLMSANFIGTSSVVIRRRVFEELGGFDERLSMGEDSLYWTQAACRFDAVFLNQQLHQYRVHGQSITQSAPLRQLESLALLHEINARNHKLPKEFRRFSRRHCYGRNLQLAKEKIRVGARKPARRAAANSIRMGRFRPQAFFVYLLTFAPFSVTRLILNWAGSR